MGIVGIIIVILLILIICYLLWSYYKKMNTSANKLDDPINLGCLTAVREIDLTKYQGKWYEIARLPTIYEKFCENPLAIYTLNNDGSMNVNNQCKIRNEIIEVKGVIRPIISLFPATSQIGRFNVYLENSKEPGEYNIIYIDQNYQYAMVGTTDRKNLWLLSRSYDVDAKKIRFMLSLAKTYGYPINNLIASTDEIDRLIYEILITNSDSYEKCTNSPHQNI